MSRKIDPAHLGRASMMAVDIINGVSYHSDQVREVLAKAYLDLLQFTSELRDLQHTLGELPTPVTVEDWRKANAKSLEGWPKCVHGVLASTDGKIWCTRCLHE